MRNGLLPLALILATVFVQSVAFAQPDVQLHPYSGAGIPQVMLDGLKQLNAGQYTLALVSFSNALKQRPNDIQARYCIAVTLHYMGDLDNAKKIYQLVANTTKDEALARRARKGIAGCAEGVSPTGLTYTRANFPSSSVVAKTFTSANDIPRRRLASGKKGVVIDVYADWCGWSTRFVPVFEHAKAAYGKTIDFARIDAEAPKNQEFCARYGVTGFPHTLIFDEYGRPVDSISGYVPYEELEQRILANYTFLKKNDVKY